MWLFCVAEPGIDTFTLFACIHRLYVILLCDCPTRHWHIHHVALCSQTVCDCTVWLLNQALTHSPCLCAPTGCLWLFYVTVQPGTDTFTLFVCIYSLYVIVLCGCPTRLWHIHSVCLHLQFVCHCSVWLPNQALIHSLCLVVSTAASMWLFCVVARHWYIHCVCLHPQSVCDCYVWLLNQTLTHSL
jgi:hypothetical protein